MSDRCLGMLGVRSFKIGVVCDRLKLGWLCAIAVWGCGMRSFKIRVVVCDRCLGMWDAIV
ncbi:MAG: hypothetical protein HEP80_14500 [Dolichospermum sp. UKL201]|nr:MAG: hypothetical protein HEP80_14500 [Dolichospermum sp. UKL201]